MSPRRRDQRVAFLGILESLEVSPAHGRAKVIINARTGSVVMNQAVTLEACAVAHGNLSVTISADAAGQPAGAAVEGKTVVTQSPRSK